MLASAAGPRNSKVANASSLGRVMPFVLMSRRSPQHLKEGGERGSTFGVVFTDSRNHSGFVAGHRFSDARRSSKSDAPLGAGHARDREVLPRVAIFRVWQKDLAARRSASGIVSGDVA